MTKYHNWNELIADCEKELRQLENDKEYCLNIYENMRQHFNHSLITQDYSSLFELLPYFETPDDYPHFHPSSETRIMYILLNILGLEIKYKKTPFLSTASSYAELQDQYTLTVFALRRLELALSDTAMDEAYSYLQTLQPSVYALGIMITNEYFENYTRLFRNIYHCLQDIWTREDIIYWLLMLSEYDSSEETLLELASAYLDANDYSNAYQTLLKISEPSSETLSILSSLKEIL